MESALGLAMVVDTRMASGTYKASMWERLRLAFEAASQEP
jgi:hypothetical protein